MAPKKRAPKPVSTRRAMVRPSTGGRYHVARQMAVIKDENVELVLRGEFTSHQVQDPFANNTLGAQQGPFSLIATPFNMNALLRMPSENSILHQCIEAMVTNVSGHGHRLEYVGPDGGEKTPAADKEAESIEAFLKHPNDEYSMLELRKRSRWDLETIGNAYIEVGRNRVGEIVTAWHIPGHLMRMTSKDKDPINVSVTLPRFSGPETRTIKKFYKRFVQQASASLVFFKEFGDPRQIDPKDGTVNKALGFEDSATEIIHIRLYHPGSPYGVPRWVNNIVAAQGSRQAELTNLEYFSENAVPAMVVLVSGGMVTDEAMTDMENHFYNVRGRAAQNRIVFIEAHGDEDAQSEQGTVPPPKLELKALAGDRPQDGLFLEYDKQQEIKVRSSFRLPPIFTGHSDDYSHASAKTSYEVAEGQVFGPERVTEDDIINRQILGGYNIEFWEVRSNPPRITDPKEVVDAIEVFETTGAMSPNIAIGMANELFDMDIPLIEAEWGSFPFTVVQLLAAQGNVIGWEKVVTEIKPVDPPPAPAPGDPDPKPVDPSVQTKEERLELVVRGKLEELRSMLKPKGLRQREPMPEAA